jgi:DNA-binding MarR family transcriptional regulator
LTPYAPSRRPLRKRKAAAAPFRLNRHLFYFFTQILARRQRALNLELRRFGLDYSRWRVIAVLNEHAGCSMQQLAELTSVDRTTLTHTLRLMESEALIVRRERASDRRSVEVSLTPHGRRKLKQILPTVLTQTDHALAGFAASEVDQLRGQLARMVDNLRN